MTGNPLAVVLDADDWPASRMQGFAAELGISETTFVLPPEGGGDHRVRIFTPLRELPMAGHPIVGTAWVLHAAGRIGETRAPRDRRRAAGGARAGARRDDGARRRREAGAQVDGAEAGRAAAAPARGADPPPGSGARACRS